MRTIYTVKESISIAIQN